MKTRTRLCSCCCVLRTSASGSVWRLSAAWRGTIGDTALREKRKSWWTAAFLRRPASPIASGRRRSSAGRTLPSIHHHSFPADRTRNSSIRTRSQTTTHRNPAPLLTLPSPLRHNHPAVSSFPQAHERRVRNWRVAAASARGEAKTPSRRRDTAALPLYLRLTWTFHKTARFVNDVLTPNIRNRNTRIHCENHRHRW